MHQQQQTPVVCMDITPKEAQYVKKMLNFYFTFLKTLEFAIMKKQKEI